jgi:hypothetical protein
LKNYVLQLAVNGSTLELQSGSYKVSSVVFISFAVIVKCLDLSNPPSVEPTYTGEANAWISLNASSLEFCNAKIYHTYNYSGWTDDVKNSAPLFFLCDYSYAKFVNITFAPPDASVVSNPFFVAKDSGTVVDIENSWFVNASLNGVSLVYDCSLATFNIVDTNFKFYFFFLFGLYMYICGRLTSLLPSSDLSNAECVYGVIYSNPGAGQGGSLRLQSSTVDNVTSSATTGGALSVFPAATSSVEIVECVFRRIKLVSSLAISGGYVYVGTTPQYFHLYSTKCYLAIVCFFFF